MSVPVDEAVTGAVSDAVGEAVGGAVGDATELFTTLGMDVVTYHHQDNNQDTIQHI